MNEPSRSTPPTTANWLRVVRALALSATTAGCASTSAAAASAQPSSREIASPRSTSAIDGAACEPIGQRTSRIEGPNTISCECVAADAVGRWTCSALLTQAPGPLFPPDLGAA